MKFFIVTCFILCLSVQGFSQKTIPLYNGQIPNNKTCGKNQSIDGLNKIDSVLVPTLTVYLPTVKDSLKTALIICPGGGYAKLAMQHEGHQVAEAFIKKGITAFVLKYRNPIDSDCFENKEIVPLQDAQRAFQLVKERATEWDIDTSKVGIMGFSAGGHLASTAATHFKRVEISNQQQLNLKPSFAILAYPVISFADSITHKGSKNNLIGSNASKEKVLQYSNELQVTSETPPTFLMHAADDRAVSVQNSLVFYKHL
ncbi:MAG: alpha/beta hydrolase [Chitinophagaceae bacterium]